jgi:hypothetical protein
MQYILSKYIQHKKRILSTYIGVIGVSTFAGMLNGADNFYHEYHADSKKYGNDHMKRFRVLTLYNMTSEIIGCGCVYGVYGMFSPVIIPMYLPVYAYNKIKEYNKKF